jgi:hypothetical protein
LNTLEQDRRPRKPEPAAQPQQTAAAAATAVATIMPPSMPYGDTRRARIELCSNRIGFSGAPHRRSQGRK